jgi:hypothetical protein
MLSGANIIFMTIFSKLIVGRPILRHYYLACFFSFVGFLIVGYSPNIAQTSVPSTSSVDFKSYVVGICLVVGYLLCHSIQGNVQELILRNNAIHVQRMIGLEGMFGLLWSFLLIMIASYITCPNENMCDLDSTMEDPIQAVYHIFHQRDLAFFCFTSVVAVLVLNLVALQLVKLVSAVYKAFWATLGIIVVWAVSILVGYEEFILARAAVQLFGFFFLILGNFTYNEIIVFPFMGFERDTRKYQIGIKKKQDG